MHELRVRSFAKINLFLHIGAKRADGFHDLETLFQTISLHDDIVFRRSSEFRLTCDDPSVPVDERNLVTRVWQALHDEFSIDPVEITLTKRIPAGGGLGGGSSNAAATLLALRKMFGLDLPNARLAEIALGLGSDVPFFLCGGTAYATGRGEELVPLPDIQLRSLLVVLPDVKISTALAFRRLAEMRAAGRAVNGKTAGLDEVRAVAASGTFQAGEMWRNDLEVAAFELESSLALLRHRLDDSGAAFVLMSGSGSTLFASYPDDASLEKGESSLREVVPTFRAAFVSRREALADFA